MWLLAPRRGCRQRQAPGAEAVGPRETGSSVRIGRRWFITNQSRISGAIQAAHPAGPGRSIPRARGRGVPVICQMHAVHMDGAQR